MPTAGGLPGVVLFLIGLLLVFVPPGFVLIWTIKLYYRLLRNYVDVIGRIFQEKPLFNIPRGQPLAEAEDVRFPTTDGLTLRGCYFKARGRRRGVILFGTEYGANRWSCRSYCEHLIEAGFDIFA